MAFAAEAAELEGRGRALLAEEHGYGFLATVAADGSPRVHPVAPILSERGLFVAVTRRSPKFADLRRDPRVALHATVRPPLDEEFVVRGIAREVEGDDARADAVSGASGGAELSDGMALFEIDLTEVGWAEWSGGRPRRRSWRPGRRTTS
jgi:hypothetical protein